MDVVSIDKTNEHFRLLYNVRGKFALHKITGPELDYKLCKVRKSQLGPKGVPFISTHDGRTLRYPHPDVQVNDTVKVNLKTNKVEDTVKFHVGALVMCTRGRNTGRVGVLKQIEKHEGSNTIVYVEDLAGRAFATLLDNVFAIGVGKKALVTLPRGGGVKLGILEEKRQKAKKAAAAHTRATAPAKA
jgi:small subunit ribosomal protein S4e